MSTDTERYNGWANYNTWNVALWFDNDEGLYTALQARQAKKFKFRRKWTGVQAKAFTLNVMGERTPDDAGLSRVRWGEIAKAWNSELEERARA